jgi:quercetin dioxygenase-like cupin family protein
MKIALPTLIAVVALTGAASTAAAESMDGHTIVAPQEIKWDPAPAVLPPGAEAAVLFGDPSKEGLFALRLKLPAGYHVPPHTHPVDEVVTVISGTFALGMGETADQSKAQTLPAGSFFALPPGTAHYVFIDEETTIQSAQSALGD